MRVLLITDDQLLTLTIGMIRGRWNLNTDHTALGEDGINRALNNSYDILLLDANLPDTYGLEVLKTLRRSRCFTPTIAFNETESDDLAARVNFLSAGADDYITKPFNNDELIARMQAVVRRSRGIADNIVKFGNAVEMNLSTSRITIGGKPFALTGKEYQLVEALALHKGRLLTREQIAMQMYSSADMPEIKTLDVFMSKLRKKLAIAGEPSVIETVWGKGYYIQNSEEDEQRAALKAARGDLEVTLHVGGRYEASFKQEPINSFMTLEQAAWAWLLLRAKKYGPTMDEAKSLITLVDPDKVINDDFLRGSYNTTYNVVQRLTPLSVHISPYIRNKPA